MNRKIIQLARRFERGSLTLVASLALTTLLMNVEFNFLEGRLYDLRMNLGSPPPADPNIVLISIDDKTMKTLDESAPLPLDYHAKFFELLEKYEPKALGYLVDFNQISQANPEHFKSDWIARLQQSASRLESRGTPIHFGTSFDVNGEVLPPVPLRSLPHSIAVIHKDGNVFAEDKVTRRALTYVNGKPTFHLRLAQSLGFMNYGEQPHGSFSVSELDTDYFFFRYHGNTSLRSQMPMAYQRISFVDFLRENFDPKLIQGKILLVGTMLKENSSDFTLTPYSREAFANPKLVVHANILDSVIHDQGISLVPNAFNWLATFITTAIVFWFVFHSMPLYGVFVTLGVAALYAAIAYFSFKAESIWLRASQPLLGVFIGYYLVVPYRLFSENKKRWDYQRKNQLLTQVEELKTNFLNLVTHDLKTPVARIQGLAEVILRNSEIRTEDRHNLNQIVHSTDELNQFITRILELSKVESNPLQIRFESKDVNSLVEKAVSALQTLARQRQVEIQMKLEPLFPIRLDASLISKVLINVIDNAIKYSPSLTAILIETRETSGFVEIGIRDHGIGLSDDEQSNLFTRFYRAKNEANARTAGTGLGLYLTKYFVEAHFGRVEVESERGRGSLFKIFLPIDPPLNPEAGAVPGLARRLAMKKLIYLKSKSLRQSVQAVEVKENNHV